MRSPFAYRAVVLAFAAALGCASPVAPTLDPCRTPDPVLTRSAFVLVSAPSPGQRVTSPLSVRGCSNTFEANVVWELRSRAGVILDRGFASGGSYDEPREFTFSAEFTVANDQLGSLTVFEPDVSDGEGFPPPRVIVPLVLAGAE